MEDIVQSPVQEQPKPKPLQKVYQLLKDKGKVQSSTFEDFERRVQAKPEMLKPIYDYLNESKVKIRASSYDQFESDMGVKKKAQPDKRKSLFYRILDKIKAMVGNRQFKGRFLSIPIKTSMSRLIKKSL